MGGRKRTTVARKKDVREEEWDGDGRNPHNEEEILGGKGSFCFLRQERRQSSSESIVERFGKARESYKQVKQGEAGVRVGKREDKCAGDEVTVWGREAQG